MASSWPCLRTAASFYLIGGDQSLDRGLGDFTDNESKDLFDLGTALKVEYVARKAHSNSQPIAWYHKFGEEKNGSELPRLFYDRLKREIFFAGGEYFVDDTNEISPGIEELKWQRNQQKPSPIGIPMACRARCTAKRPRAPCTRTS